MRRPIAGCAPGETTSVETIVFTPEEKLCLAHASIAAQAAFQAAQPPTGRLTGRDLLGGRGKQGAVDTAGRNACCSWQDYEAEYMDAYADAREAWLDELLEQLAASDCARLADAATRTMGDLHARGGWHELAAATVSYPCGGCNVPCGGPGNFVLSAQDCYNGTISASSPGLTSITLRFCVTMPRRELPEARPDPSLVRYRSWTDELCADADEPVALTASMSGFEQACIVLALAYANSRVPIVERLAIMDPRLAAAAIYARNARWQNEYLRGVEGCSGYPFSGERFALVVDGAARYSAGLTSIRLGSGAMTAAQFGARGVRGPYPGEVKAILCGNPDVLRHFS